jgi:hypothetical protein
MGHIAEQALRRDVDPQARAEVDASALARLKFDRLRIRPSDLVQRGSQAVPVGRHVWVVAAVGEQLPRSSSWPATPPADRRHRLDQRDELGDVVAGCRR